MAARTGPIVPLVTEVLNAAAYAHERAVCVDTTAAGDTFAGGCLGYLTKQGALTPGALRHTCIAHLVRQGLRFSDLDRVAGPLPADALAAYAELSPPGVRRSLAELQRFMPALDHIGRAAA